MKTKTSNFTFAIRMRQKIPVGYLKELPQEPVEWGWASPAGGMFTSIEDIAKVKLLPVCSQFFVTNEHMHLVLSISRGL